MARPAAIGRDFRAGAVFACALLLAGCAGFATRPLPPQVEVTGLRVLSLQPSDLRVRVGLRVDNPNAFALDVAAVDASIAVNGVQLAEATLPAPVTIAAAGISGVELELRTRLEHLVRVVERGDGAGRVPYDVTGTAVLRDGTRLPFARRGDVPVGEWLQGRRR